MHTPPTSIDAALRSAPTRRSMRAAALGLGLSLAPVLVPGTTGAPAGADTVTVDSEGVVGVVERDDVPGTPLDSRAKVNWGIVSGTVYFSSAETRNISRLFGSWARRHAGEPGLAPNDLDVVLVCDERLSPAQVLRFQSELTDRIHLPVDAFAVSPSEWEEPGDAISAIRSGPVVTVQRFSDA